MLGVKWLWTVIDVCCCKCWCPLHPRI